MSELLGYIDVIFLYRDLWPILGILHILDTKLGDPLTLYPLLQ